MDLSAGYERSIVVPDQSAPDIRTDAEYPNAVRARFRFVLRARRLFQKLVELLGNHFHCNLGLCGLVMGERDDIGKLLTG